MATRTAKPRVRPNMWLGRPLTVILSLIAACVPIFRLVFGTDTVLQLSVLSVVGLLLTALGYVARPPHWWLWVAGAVMIPAAGLVSGVNSSISSSLLAGILTAVMILTTACILTRLVTERPQSVRYLVTGFVVGQTASAIAGILQLLGVHVAEGLIFGRATGLAEHPNTLGLMATIVILISIGAWSSAPGFVRIVLVGVMAVNGAALVGTGSLSAMLALGAGLFVGILAARKAIGTAVTGVLTLAVAGGALAVANVEQTFLDSILYRVAVVTGQAGSGGGAASLEVRELTYAWAWNWIDRSPILGVGLDPRNAGTFDGITVVHNYLLRGWYQGGIIYVAWLALLTVTVIFGVVVPALRRRADPWAASIAFGILVFSLTAAFFNQPQYWLPLLFAIVVAPRASSLATAPPATETSRRAKRPRRKVLTATGVSHSL